MPAKKLLFLILTLGIFLYFQQAEADSYDLYVDKNCESTQDGSSEKPYCSISDALEKTSNDKNKIYIKSGTYKEKIILEKNIKIYGKDANSVAIENPTNSGSTIVGKGSNTIKNITVKGGSNGIAFEKEGLIEKCIIKKVTKNAIDLLPNDGKVEIANNKIFDNAKGVYVESGRSINIHNNEITENLEEGVDLREDISGSIENNNVSRNGEGGIELIVGKANLIINNNILSKNKASGIAAQFYSFVSKIGEVIISNNKISENKEYGLTCKNTLGGSFSENYWDKSIELLNNTIENNKTKAIDPKCAIVKAVGEEEENKNKIEDSNPDNELNLEEKERTAEEKAKKEQEEKQEQQELAILEKVNKIESDLENYIIKSTALNQEIKARGKIKIFFFGYDKEKISELKNLNIQQEANKEILEKIKILTQRDLIKERIDLDINNFNNISTKNQNLIAEKAAKKGILGWLINIFD